MAEICCGMAAEAEATATTTTCEPTTRVARRRRMEIRRFRHVSPAAGVVAQPRLRDEPGRKRQRMEVGAAAAAASAVLNIAGGEVEEDSQGSPEVTAGDALYEPETAAGNECPRFGVTSLCGRRRDMEDAVSIQPSFSGGDGLSPAKSHFFGVFDGHGCSHVAISCKERMHEILTEELAGTGTGTGTSTGTAEWTALMEQSFARMDAEATARTSAEDDERPTCRCELQKPQCDTVGSTAVVAVVTADKIVVANCGDSRAVLCRNGSPVPLSTDHKPDRPDELQRIQSAGGRVIYWDGARVLGVLAMSRAIGDSYLKPYVVAEPEVTVTERGEGDECLILASDGLWDVVSNGTACEVVRMCLRGGSEKACSDAAMLLSKLALARNSSDNVSVVVVDLRKNFH
ncbi:Protein phosphatase 2C 37 [Acorus calamus]|uniref:protein-serine/threonine phosphatase n=1 Tax=Acorus calamus TaxID=4465 RepID=A0AAV9EI35_ACOCL|nr:Protein phosphatase 2C 37 [Acorus calamus]